MPAGYLPSSSLFFVSDAGLASFSGPGYYRWRNSRGSYPHSRRSSLRLRDAYRLRADSWLKANSWRIRTTHWAGKSLMRGTGTCVGPWTRARRPHPGRPRGVWSRRRYHSRLHLRARPPAGRASAAKQECAVRAAGTSPAYCSAPPAATTCAATCTLDCCSGNVRRGTRSPCRRSDPSVPHPRRGVRSDREFSP